MLELPEVEVLRRDLEKEVVGKRIKDVNVRVPGIVTGLHRTRPDFTKLLAGRKIGGIRRRGTVLLLDLDEGMTWLIDPGATGSVTREATGRAGPSVSWVVTFVGGGALHGSDGREGQTHMGVVPTADAHDAAAALIRRLFADRLARLATRGAALDYKTSLQELSAARFESLPQYLVTEEGPDHRKRFTAIVEVAGEVTGRGSGRNKKQAEEAAAREAYQRLVGTG